MCLSSVLKQNLRFFRLRKISSISKKTSLRQLATCRMDLNHAQDRATVTCNRDAPKWSRQCSHRMRLPQVTRGGADSDNTFYAFCRPAGGHMRTWHEMQMAGACLMAHGIWDFRGFRGARVPCFFFVFFKCTPALETTGPRGPTQRDDRYAKRSVLD